LVSEWRFSPLKPLFVCLSLFNPPQNAPPPPSSLLIYNLFMAFFFALFFLSSPAFFFLVDTAPAEVVVDVVAAVPEAGYEETGAIEAIEAGLVMRRMENNQTLNFALRLRNVALAVGVAFTLTFLRGNTTALPGVDAGHQFGPPRVFVVAFHEELSSLVVEAALWKGNNQEAADYRQHVGDRCGGRPILFQSVNANVPGRRIHIGVINFRQEEAPGRGIRKVATQNELQLQEGKGRSDEQAL